MKRVGDLRDWAKSKIKNARIPSPEGSAEDGGADADYVPSSKEIEEKNKRRLAAIAAMPVEDFNASQEFIVKEVERMRPRVPAGAGTRKLVRSHRSMRVLLGTTSVVPLRPLLPRLPPLPPLRLPLMVLRPRRRGGAAPRRP